MMVASKLPKNSHKSQEYYQSTPRQQMAGMPYNINSFPGNLTVPSQPVIIVRAEEALIVALVLALWVAAIALFFNRWGKIRMLEPYQPKFIQQHRPSCPLVDQVQHRSCSKFNINQDILVNHQKVLRPRQNSVFVGSSMITLPVNAPRKVKSAFDLQNLILSDPALNKSGTRIDFGRDYNRRSSLFPVYHRKSVAESEVTPHAGERRLSFKDLVDLERSQRFERVQCYLEKEPTEAESCRRNRKESKQRSSISNQSTGTNSRHNSITNQEIKGNLSASGKSCGHNRRSSWLTVQRELPQNCKDASELRTEVKGGMNNFRRNSMLLINTLENERNFLIPRENFKSGVIDFRRNSMLIINNLTEDIGCKSMGRNFSLGGSNVALGADYSFTGRRNSVIPPYGSEPKTKLGVPHVPIVKTKSATNNKPNPVNSVEIKHLSNQKYSKSLDCGDPGKAPVWKNKKETSQVSLSNAAEQQLQMPTQFQNFVGSSTSLTTIYSRHGSRSVDQSRSTENLNTGIVQPTIIETKCYSPNSEKSPLGCLRMNMIAPSKEHSAVLELTADQETRDGKDNTPNVNPNSGVNITTSLTNLNIKSGTPLNVSTFKDGGRQETKGTKFSHV